MIVKYAASKNSLIAVSLLFFPERMTKNYIYLLLGKDLGIQ